MPDEELVPSFWRPTPGEKVVIRFLPFDANVRKGGEMPTDMGHERMRWQSMGFQQLVTRLNKIRVPEKLANFIRMCGEYWDDPPRRGATLCRLARDRARALGLHTQADFAVRMIERMLPSPTSVLPSLGDPQRELVECARRVTSALRAVSGEITFSADIPQRVVVVSCNHCRRHITAVPLTARHTQDGVNRVVEMATQLIATHMVDECSAREPERKVRVIRMGKEGR